MGDPRGQKMNLFDRCTHGSSKSVPDEAIRDPN